MKTHLPLLSVVVLVGAEWLGSPAAGNAQVLPPGALVLTAADNGTTAVAVVGQAILVNLHGNLSTGYAWDLTGTNGNSVLTNGPVTYTVDGGGGVGVGGTFSFPFVAAATGDTALTFADQRAGSGPPVESFGVTIRVLAPPRLSVKLVHANVVISWPIAGSANFFLEGATRLDPPQWAALNVLPLPDGTNYTVTLGAGGTALYFRLRL